VLPLFHFVTMGAASSKALARHAVDWALGKKAEDVLVMDLREILDVTDFFVIATGFSETQVRAIADAIYDAAIEMGQKPLHMEGRSAGRWVLIDFVDVVVHVMLPEERDRYKLDRLWGDAPVVRFDDRGTEIGPSRSFLQGESDRKRPEGEVRNP